MAPTTRSSIRHSLGKAIADVISKEGKDGDKATKKIKETRRLSAINLKSAAPRNSMGEVRPPLHPVKRIGTPESSTLARKRPSVTAQRGSQDEQSSKSSETTPQNAPVTRSSTLRPSSRLNTISALPKYRPRSVASEIVKPPPPPSSPRVNTRRRLRASEDEKEDRPVAKDLNTTPSSSDRGSRPISPLPHRALRKSPPSRSTSSTPSPRRPATSPANVKSSPTLPSRPPKAVKTGTSSTAAQVNVSRPSSSSSSCSGTPRTPKTNTTKGNLRRSGSPSFSPRPSEVDSPLARRKQMPVFGLTVGNMSHISESASEEEDVALLLAPTADPAAPTPAMPRLSKSRNRDKHLPMTPTRPTDMLPSRAQMSYRSPLPPGESSSFLRPPKPSGDDRVFRGSILSWEQLANEASKTLGEDEVHSMLADMPAPFSSAPMSPSISSNGMDVPDSPCLSALNSPNAFGSISQVLLPDVTPSPAVHNGTLKYDMSNELGPVDGAIVTLLRLQLIAAENTAKERLTLLQTMEEEVHNLKEEHKRQTSDLSVQVLQMQQQLRVKEEDEEQQMVEKATLTAVLEERLREAQASRERAIQDAIAQCKQHERELRKANFGLWRVLSETSCSAVVVRASWGSVRDLSEAEVETVRGDRQLLSLVLSELDRIALLVQ